ncbi:MAG: FKBP-type peptidyl-prolyl cis-trans isomerase [Bacteroidota bacterium]
MRNLILSALCILTLLASCGEGDKNTTANGYKLQRFKDGKGKKPAVGDLAFVNLYFYMDGKMQTSTRQQNRVMPVKVYSTEELKKMKETGTPNPLYEAISVMSVGDSLRVDVPITDEMRKDERMVNAKEMFYHIVMEDAKTQDEFNAERQAEKDRMEQLSLESQARVGEVSAIVTDIAAEYRAGKISDKITTTNSGLKYMVLENGTGAACSPGQNVQVHYYGTLTNGEMFDNSFQRGQPFTFKLGVGQVIKGWDEGVALLKGGDKAVLFIPSELGYGKAGGGAKIPGDSELIFYIEAL